MEFLPNETILVILRHLRMKDVLTLSRVNHRFHLLSQDDYFWQGKYKEEYPTLGLTPKVLPLGFRSWYYLSIAISNGSLRFLLVLNKLNDEGSYAIIRMSRKDTAYKLIDRIYESFPNLPEKYKLTFLAHIDNKNPIILDNDVPVRKSRVNIRFRDISYDSIWEQCKKITIHDKMLPYHNVVNFNTGMINLP